MGDTIVLWLLVSDISLCITQVVYCLSLDFTVPSQPPTPLPTQAPTLPSDTNSNDDNSSEFGGLSQTYWIIVAVGGFVVLVALVGFGSWYCLRAKPKKENALLDNYQTSA